MNQSESSVNDARHLWEKGLAQEALAAFQDQARSQGQTPEILEGIGSSLWSIGQFDEALETFTQARLLQDDNPAHWSNCGLCLRELGRATEASICFKNAIKRNPFYAPAYNEWGNTLQDMAHYHQAASYYQIAVSLDPKRGVYRHNYGVCLKRIGQPVQAEALFQAALQLDETYTPSLEELGILSLESGDRNQALRFFHLAATPRARTYCAGIQCTDSEDYQALSFPGIFLALECAYLRQYINQSGCEWARTSTSADPTYFEVDTERRCVQRAPLTIHLEKFIAHRVQQLALRLAQSHGIRCTSIETPQLLRYRKGHFFSYHQDGAYNGPSASSRHRVTAIVIGLNESGVDFTGGDLRFFKNEEQAIRNMPLKHFQQQTGRALVFPVNVFHDVTRILSGERFTLVTWLLDNTQRKGVGP